MLTALAVAAALPLGAPGLPETRESRTLAPGVEYTKIVRGTPDADAFWTVDVAVLADRAAAEARAAQIPGARVDALPRPDDDRAPGPLGYRVRAGRFATQTEANAYRATLGTGSVVYSGEDGTATTGPWVVNVLRVQRRFRGEVEPVLATGVVPGREPLSALAARTGAFASVNGGYFVIGAANGTDGDLAGLSVIDGELVSEAVDGRTSLVFDGDRTEISTLADKHTLVTSSRAHRELDGVNREPGLIRACGDETAPAKHDFTCTDPSEVIRYETVFGTTTPAGAGSEAVLDRWGRVVAQRPRGGALPLSGSVLAGTGDGATWLAQHARPGRFVTTLSAIHGDDGLLWLKRGTGVVNGGPRLLPRITAEAEGFDWAEDPGFYYRFGLRRNPRTFAGTTPSGDLLLVTVDGRAPGYSAGASFAEEAAILEALGAREGVNLDGGGSTTMTVGSSVVTRPSDAGQVERPIADAIVLTAKG
ncbi:phosphodiester glycosidase family protein [Solirubrobacter sp. CPCC 204708]|uniref:Phosphodiester glycosidase family protein n=1 Tax=Solirubrobacter deserti TaxID=2282478 RepID=A0ABT4RHA3_9ACTN|nr:phosphodiester glycosidase family protein [Solirubrobacter deserti]MBE2315233.1 phosphodiester glycosidase family protein [Solirubrobacter deserti]MDA0137917.1 phosphodiester glycosidase family protein [Solirubrobacter deserti]